MAANDSNILYVDGINVNYGEVTAMHEVSLEISAGEIVALIGRNGAGKSTLLKAILGTQPTRSGIIQFLGRDITRLPVDRIVSLGMAIVPEGRGVLPMMTVIENLLLGAFHSKHDCQEDIEQAFHRFPILDERRNQPAGQLSGGQQQMLAIARALMSRPKLLLMDEPSLGLAPVIVNQVYDVMLSLKEEGQTILLSEQYAHIALEYADRGYVLELGRNTADGSSDALLADSRMRKAYLGSRS